MGKKTDAKAAAAPKKPAVKKAAATKPKKDQEPEGSTRKDPNAMLNGLKYRRDKKGETEAGKILEVGFHKNKSILSIFTDLTLSNGSNGRVPLPGLQPDDHGGQEGFA